MRTRGLRVALSAACVGVAWLGAGLEHGLARAAAPAAPQSAAVESAGVAGVPVRAVTAEDVWRAEVELAGALSRDGVGSAEKLERVGITSSWELRGVAARVRSAGERLAAGPVSGVDANLAVLARGRKVAEAVWPGIELGLHSGMIAGALEAAAGDGEARAIQAWQTWAESAVERGERAHAGSSGVWKPAAARRTPSVDAAFAVLMEVKAAWGEQLDELAVTVSPEHADEVAGTWKRSSPRRMTAVTAAVSKIGARYRFASRGPEEFDCSGLMVWSWGQAGLMLRGSSLSQINQVVPVGVDELRSGDLVLRASGRENPVGEADGHVGLVLAVTRAGVVIADASNVAGKVRAGVRELQPGSIAGRVRLAEERIEGLVMPGRAVVWRPQR